ncbi:O-antigen ligase family protein [Microcella sp.]|uniref:O-antigen ligase family protein n=1 Tax=Microcella sp. TaxID=1913979 RepID=UPI0039199B06
MAVAATTALIVAAVLAWAPEALDRWTIPKLLVLAIAALVALAAPPRGRLPRLVIGLGMLAAALIVASALLTADPISSALGRWPRFDGLIALSGVAIAAWLGARLLGPGPGSPHAPVRGLTLAVAIGSGVLALVTAAEQFGLRPIASDLDRPGALLGSASDQGTVAAVALALLVARLALPVSALPRARGLELAAAFAGAIAALATVTASGSRAALLGAALALVAAALLAVRHADPDRRRTLGIIGASLAGLIAGALVVPGTAQRLLDATGLAAESAIDRVLIYGETLATLAAHPLLGTAPGGFIDAVAAQHSAAWFAAVGQQTVLDSPHNLALQLAVGGGPLLLLVGLALLALTVAAVVRGRRGAHAPVVIMAASGLIAVLVPLAVQPTAAATLLLLGLLAGALLAAPAPTSAPRGRTLATGALLAGVAAALAVLLVGELHLGRAAQLAGSPAGPGTTTVTEIDAALSSARAARPFDPDVAIIGAELLVARVDAGDRGAISAARQWVDRATLAAPGSLAAGRAAVTLAIAEGDLPLARASVDALIERVPRHPWPRHRSGGIALFEGDLERAERDLLLAAELDPAWADPWLTLAALYDLRGQSDQAQQALDEARLRGADE